MQGVRTRVAILQDFAAEGLGGLGHPDPTPIQGALHHGPNRSSMAARTGAGILRSRARLTVSGQEWPWWRLRRAGLRKGRNRCPVRSGRVGATSGRRTAEPIAGEGLDAVFHRFPALVAAFGQRKPAGGNHAPVEPRQIGADLVEFGWGHHQHHGGHAWMGQEAVKERWKTGRPPRSRNCLGRRRPRAAPLPRKAGRHPCPEGSPWMPRYQRIRAG